MQASMPYSERLLQELYRWEEFAQKLKKDLEKNRQFINSDLYNLLEENYLSTKVYLDADRKV